MAEEAMREFMSPEEQTDEEDETDDDDDDDADENEDSDNEIDNDGEESSARSTNPFASIIRAIQRFRRNQWNLVSFSIVQEKLCDKHDYNVKLFIHDFLKKEDAKNPPAMYIH